MFSLRREQGRLAEMLPLFKHFVATTTAAATWKPGLALVYAELGMADAARAEFDRLAADDFSGVPHDGVWLTSMTYLAEVASYLNDARRPATLPVADALWRPQRGCRREHGLLKFPAGLSKREAYVLRFVAAGMSNQQIGERLFISPNTVANHIRSILAKTGTANRTEAAVFAVRHGLAPPGER